MSNTILLSPSTKGQAKRFGSLRTIKVSSQVLIRKSVPTAGKDTLWISDDQEMTQELLKSIDWPTKRLGSALLLFKPQIEVLTALWTCFDRVAFCSNGGFLPPEEIGEVLTAKNRDDLFICGAVDEGSQTVTLWRGNLDSLVVPFSAFTPSGDGIVPNFDDFGVTDYGQTIRFGDYEAATDAILYEYDPKYRRRKTKERIASEQGLGPSLRRLRKQRGLRREDFPGIDPKTIARIEQGKVRKVRSKTLSAIAEILQVKPEELETY